MLWFIVNIYHRITIHTKFAGPMQIFNIKSLTMLAFLFELRVMLLLTKVLLHAVLFKVALQLFTSIHPSHANRFMKQHDKENRLTTLFGKILCNSVAHTSIRDLFALRKLEVGCSIRQTGNEALS